MKRFLISAILVLSASLSPSFAAENSTSVSSSATASNPYNKSATEKVLKGNPSTVASSYSNEIKKNKQNVYKSNSGDSKTMEFLRRIADLLIEFSNLVKVFFFMLGLAYLIKTIYNFKDILNHGGSQNANRNLWISLGVSVLIMNGGSTVTTLSNTLFNENVCKDYDYVACNSSFFSGKGELHSAMSKVFDNDNPVLQEPVFSIIKTIIFILQILGFIFACFRLHELYLHANGSLSREIGVSHVLFGLLAACAVANLNIIVFMMFDFLSNFV